LTFGQGDQTAVVGKGAYNPYAGGGCTAYAWSRRQDIPPWPGEGNAGNWANNAARDGFPVDNTAEVGAIMAWPASQKYSQWGHVAYVEQVDGDRVQVSEASYYTGDTVIRYRWVSASADGARFIHAKGYTGPSNPAPPPSNPVPPPVPQPVTSVAITGNPCSTAESAPNCVPARVSAGPSNNDPKVGAFNYGQVLTARCWANGQVLTDGNNSDPSDDARQFTSGRWYGIDWNGGRGYVAAVWTTKNNETFGLPQC
jgi:hypothetical protein